MITASQRSTASNVQEFPVLPTKVQAKDETFVSNRAANLEVLGKVDELLAKARAGGGPKYVERHKNAGKLLPR